MVTSISEPAMWSSYPRRAFSASRAGAALVLWAVGAGAAYAADWSLKGTLAETGTFESNSGLSTASSAGNVFGLTSAITLDLLAKTPTSSLSLTTNLAYPYHFGRGADGIEDKLHYGGTAKFETHTHLDVYTLSASLTPESTRTSELLDSGKVTVDAVRLTYSANAGVSHKIDPLNSARLSASYTRVDFNGGVGELTPFSSYGFDASWQRRLTKRTDLNTTLSYSRYEPESTVAKASDTYSATIGITSAFTKQLSLAASGGARLTDTEDVGFALGRLFNVSLTYKLKETSFSFTASETASPSSLGVIQDTTAFGATITQTLNDMAQASLALTYSRQGADGGDRQLFVIAPTYALKLGKELNAQLGYKFTERTDPTGSANSHSVTLGLSQGFELFH